MTNQSEGDKSGFFAGETRERFVVGQHFSGPSRFSFKHELSQNNDRNDGAINDLIFGVISPISADTRKFDIKYSSTRFGVVLRKPAIFAGDVLEAHLQ